MNKNLLYVLNEVEEFNSQKMVKVNDQRLSDYEIGLFKTILSEYSTHINQMASQNSVSLITKAFIESIRDFYGKRVSKLDIISYLKSKDVKDICNKYGIYLYNRDIYKIYKLISSKSYFKEYVAMLQKQSIAISKLYGYPEPEDVASYLVPEIYPKLDTLSLLKDIAGGITSNVDRYGQDILDIIEKYDNGKFDSVSPIIKELIVYVTTYYYMNEYYDSNMSMTSYLNKIWDNQEPKMIKIRKLMLGLYKMDRDIVDKLGDIFNQSRKLDSFKKMDKLFRYGNYVKYNRDKAVSIQN